MSLKRRARWFSFLSERFHEHDSVRAVCARVTCCVHRLRAAGRLPQAPQGLPQGVWAVIRLPVPTSGPGSCVGTVSYVGVNPLMAPRCHGCSRRGLH